MTLAWKKTALDALVDRRPRQPRLCDNCFDAPELLVKRHVRLKEQFSRPVIHGFSLSLRKFDGIRRRETTWPADPSPACARPVEREGSGGTVSASGSMSSSQKSERALPAAGDAVWGAGPVGGAHFGNWSR